jgi:hypothetical protein
MRTAALLAAALFVLPGAAALVGAGELTLDFSKEKLPDG